MKTWNNAEIVELDVAATANGLFDANIETCVLWDKVDKKPVTPETPVTPENPTEQHS